MIELRRINPIRLPVAEVLYSADWTRWRVRLHLAAVLSVKAWKLSGSFSVARPIDPPPETEPFYTVETATLEATLTLSPANNPWSERFITAVIIPSGGLEWYGESDSGAFPLEGYIITQIGGGIEAAGTPGVGWLDFTLSAYWGAGGDQTEVLITDRAAGSSLTIEAFGESFTTPARLGGYPAENVPPASNVVLAAVEYWTYGGRFDPATGAPS